jgi:hypothetical protein
MVGDRIAGQSNFLDNAQNILGLAGMIPVVGAIADGINAVGYGLRGKWGDAGLSALSALPGVGDAFAAPKVVKGAGELFDETTKAMRYAPTR